MPQPHPATVSNKTNNEPVDPPEARSDEHGRRPKKVVSHVDDAGWPVRDAAALRED